MDKTRFDAPYHPTSALSLAWLRGWRDAVRAQQAAPEAPAGTLEQYLADRAAKVPTSVEGFVTGTGAGAPAARCLGMDCACGISCIHPTNPTE